MSFMKVEPGQTGYLQDYPQQCICGSQKGPMVATGLTYRVAQGVGAEAAGQVYLCRMCTTRAARALGLVEGDEHERLQNAADELATAEQEIATRQEIIDQQTVTLGLNETKITQQAGYIENLNGELRLIRAQAAQVSATAREMAAV